ncbi:hypothetical protein [Bizionia psychrotolerans]|uniref:hypothetical protein n=1 Tax=Bizionia psychrotolerans TaxID=1492901 RepID=UPI0006505B78|nr:hypothetical protein [Bizionia psychrotolerans]
MNKLPIFFLIAWLSLSTQIHAQTTRYISTKCYIGYFSYDKKYELKRVDCAKPKAIITNPIERNDIEKQQAIIKMKAYQEKLKNLGYHVDITGRIDDKTAKAHNRYLSKQQRLEKRKQRADKKTTES